METSKILSQTDSRLWPEPLKEWLANAQVAGLFRINLAELAQSLKLELAQILPAFLQASHDGVFNLSWEYLCPHCNAIPDFKHNFSDSHSEGSCEICKVSFRNTLDANVEVTFTIHESIITLPPEIMTDWQKNMLAAAQDHSLGMPEHYLSGLDCLTNPLFRQLFGDDVLSAEESLAIRRIALLFTDIKDSTRMYSDLGDSRSYNIVRDHFKVLFSSIETEGGLVVKTIGDAVMAVFNSASKAMEAALDARDRLSGLSWGDVAPLEIKMGIHVGSAIAVNLDNRMDYFGNTVNLAARIQGLAKHHTICFSQAVLDEAQCRALLKAWQKSRGIRIIHQKANLKGIGETSFYRIED